MPKAKTLLDMYVERLDIMCDVVTNELLKNGKLKNATARSFLSTASKVVTEYYEEQKNVESAS